MYISCHVGGWGEGKKGGKPHSTPPTHPSVHPITTQGMHPGGGGGGGGPPPPGMQMQQQLGGFHPMGPFPFPPPPGAVFGFRNRSVQRRAKQGRACTHSSVAFGVGLFYWRALAIGQRSAGHAHIVFLLVWVSFDLSQHSLHDHHPNSIEPAS